MTTKKYEILRDQAMEHEGRTLYRIRRLSDGKIGGWIEKEENLAQEGQCFVYDNAKVFGDAEVYDNAWVYGRARVFDDAEVCGDVQVFGDAEVFGDARVYEYAKVFSHAKVFCNANVGGFARLFGDAKATKKVIWKEMPRHSITASDNHIAIGCEHHTLDHWREHIEEIGKKHGYSDKEIALYRKAIFGKAHGETVKFILRHLNGFARFACEKLENMATVASLLLLISLPFFCVVGLPPEMLFWVGIGCLPILFRAAIDLNS
jgi:hypothetical protein